MFRVNRESLTFQDGKYYFDNTEFNGIGFFYGKDEEIKAYFFHDGIKQEPYKSDFFSCDKDTLFIGESFPAPHDGYCGEVQYKGVAFSGIQYRFDRDYCAGEALYKDGWEVSSIEYNLNPNYKHDIAYASLNDKKNDLFQKFERYYDGSWKSVYINQKETFNISLKFSADNQVNVIDLQGDVFSKLSNHSEKLLFNPFPTLESLKQLNLGEWLLLKGDFINDEMLSLILNLTGVEKVKKVTVDRTSITKRSFMLLEQKLISLRDLNFYPDLPKGIEKKHLIKLPKINLVK